MHLNFSLGDYAEQREIAASLNGNMIEAALEQIRRIYPNVEVKDLTYRIKLKDFKFDDEGMRFTCSEGYHFLVLPPLQLSLLFHISGFFHPVSFAKKYFVDELQVYAAILNLIGLDLIEIKGAVLSLYTPPTPKKKSPLRSVKR